MRERSIAVVDLDNTIYAGHSFFSVAKYLVLEGILNNKTWEEIESELGKYKKGEQSYADAVRRLFKAFGDGLAGKDYLTVAEAVKKYFDVDKSKFFEYFGNILPDLQKTHEVWLVTNNSQMVAEAIVSIFGLDGYLSTELEVENGRFTGRILKSFADGKESVGELIAKYGGQTLAIGDSHNDVGMLSRVRNPVCFQPDEDLAKIASEKGWYVINKENALEVLRGVLGSLNV